MSKQQDNNSIPLLQSDFVSRSLHQDSNIRSNKIFTLDRSLILYRIGHLTEDKLNECIEKVCSIVRNEKSI